jgi:hypothetical protein
MPRLLMPVLCLCLLLTAGCKGTRYEKTITIEKDAPYHETEFRGPRSEQTVTVTAKSETPISVYLTLADDKAEAIVAIRAGKKPRRTLDAAEAATEANLEARVPAGRGFVVLIRPTERSKEVKVELDVQGK